VHKLIVDFVEVITRKYIETQYTATTKTIRELHESLINTIFVSNFDSATDTKNAQHLMGVCSHTRTTAS